MCFETASRCASRCSTKGRAGSGKFFKLHSSSANVLRARAMCASVQRTVSAAEIGSGAKAAMSERLVSAK